MGKNIPGLFAVCGLIEIDIDGPVPINTRPACDFTTLLPGTLEDRMLP